MTYVFTEDPSGMGETIGRDGEQVTIIGDGYTEGTRLIRFADGALTDAFPHELSDRDDWPVHQPECFDAPIPGRQWFAGCEPGGDWDSELGRYTGTGPRVDPVTGVCEACGQTACRTCGRENCPDHG